MNDQVLILPSNLGLHNEDFRVVVSDDGSMTMFDGPGVAQPVQTLMDEMKKENKDKSLISSLNIKIDELVMDLFQLTDEEKQTVREFEV